MRHIRIVVPVATLLACAFFVISRASVDTATSPAAAATLNQHAQTLVSAGKHTFRFDTFGDEAFWGGELGLHKAIEGAKLGGVGSGLSPMEALQLGLKVDVDALPASLVQALKAGKVNLKDPATTLALLKLNAVVGVTGFFNKNGSLKAVGIQCALCHSTVDNSFTTGIGQRLDGWPNRDLNVGAIIALAPNLEPFAKVLNVTQKTVREVLHTWGPGKFDAELILDGKTKNPAPTTNGVVGPPTSSATLLPPAFGLAGVNLHTWTGAWGTIPYWNAFVAVLEMHGKGTFFDPRLTNPAQFPVAAREGFGNIRNSPDLVSSTLPALQFYQLAIAAPHPPKGSFDEDAARRGKELFDGRAKCSTCHVPPTFTEPGWNLHKASEVCIDGFEANRAPDHRYRTSPLNGLWTHTKGGFYHDGRFATLTDVVKHYDKCMDLGLTAGEINDLAEYLKSLPE